jgi:Na+/H+-dicarboxylate symporter
LAYRSGTNTLGIIFFCLTFGTVLGSIGKRGRVVIDFFGIIDEVIMKMVYGIMWLVYLDLIFFEMRVVNCKIDLGHLGSWALGDFKLLLSL